MNRGIRWHPKACVWEADGRDGYEWTLGSLGMAETRLVLT